MARFLNCRITFVVLLITVVSTIDGFGFPFLGGGGGCGCPCGGGGGGGGPGGNGCCGNGGVLGGLGGIFGRKKRDTDAVQPHYMAVETPCPQALWKPIIEESIKPGNTIGSVSAIQTALFRQYTDQKFLVTCYLAAAADQQAINGTAVTNKVHFSSAGDGYCNLVKERIWCQAVALSA